MYQVNYIYFTFISLLSNIIVCYCIYLFITIIIHRLLNKKLLQHVFSYVSDPSILLVCKYWSSIAKEKRLKK